MKSVRMIPCYDWHITYAIYVSVCVCVCVCVCVGNNQSLNSFTVLFLSLPLLATNIPTFFTFSILLQTFILFLESPPQNFMYNCYF